jgi:hypothetical protein
LLVIVDLAYLAPSTSGIGYLLVLTGIPIYFFWRKSALAAEKNSAIEKGLSTELAGPE